MNEAPPLDQLLVHLYQCFSEAAYDREWYRQPQRVRAQFVAWLRENITQAEPVEGFKKDCLPELRECWNDASQPRYAHANAGDNDHATPSTHRLAEAPNRRN